MNQRRWPALLFYMPPVGLPDTDPRAVIARRLGEGQRLVLAFAPGRKYVTLISPATLAVARRVPIAELARAEVADVPLKRVVRLIARKRRDYRRLGISHDTKTARRVERLLRDSTP